MIERWTQLFKAPLLIDRMRKGERLIKAEQKRVTECVQEWRSRLTDLGWFMRCLNESLAQQANTEDTAQDDSGKGVIRARLCWMSRLC